MLKIKMLSIFICIWMLFSYGEVCAQPVSSQTPEAIVKSYLNQKMKVIISHDLDTLDNYFSKLDAKAASYLAFIKIHLLQDYLLSYSNSNLIIERLSPKVKVINLQYENNDCFVKASLKSVVYWNAANPLGPPLKGTLSEQHYIRLSREGSIWRVVSDKFQSDHQYSESCESTPSDLLNRTLAYSKKELSASLTRSKESPPTKLQLVPHHAPSDKERNNLYNREGAYNWANKYWEKYSGNFVNLGDEAWEGGDCTNFISQCLKAGGADNDMQGSYKWYYIRNGRSGNKGDNFSWTWSTARGLNSVILGNFNKKEFGPKGIEKVISGDSSYTSELGEFIDIGDILQYEFEAGNGIKHSAIIVGKIFNSEAKSYQPVISTHSFDSWNLPWTKNAYKTHFVHITGIN